MLEILYHDEDLVAINKPAGLLVHRSNLDRYETLNALKILSAQIGSYIYPVHRLDKPTSGVLLFALSEHAARSVAMQFQSQTVTKHYQAVVRGHLHGSGTIDNPIRDRDNKDKDRQPAVSEFATLAQIELPYAVDRYPTSRYSHVQLRPHSGRRHQLRLHMKHLGHPIVGDTSYGKSTHNRFFARQYNCNRLLLHASQLIVRHPRHDHNITLQADIADEQFAQILNLSAWRTN